MKIIESDSAAVREYVTTLRNRIKQEFSSYSSTNFSKGALLAEAEILFSYLANNHSLESTRKAVVVENIFGKKMVETRRRCWQVLHSRYFPDGENTESIHPIIAVYRRDVREGIRCGILYYHYATSDLFSYEATTQLIYSLAQRGIKSIAPRDVHNFLQARRERHPEAMKWSPQTVQSLVNHYLSAVRDFGILEGKVRKRIRRPTIEEELFLYVVTCLRDCGQSPKEIFASSDFKLFMLSQNEVEARFLEAQRKGRIRFQRSGRIVSLELPWRTILEYIKTIG